MNTLVSPCYSLNNEFSMNEVTHYHISDSYALHHGIHQSVFMPPTVPNPNKDMPLNWDQHSKLLPGVDTVRGSQVAKWTVEDVAGFVSNLPGCAEQGKLFKDEVSVMFIDIAWVRLLLH